jgi:hypothetical protein
VNRTAYAELMTDHRLPGGSGIYHDNYMDVSDAASLRALWDAGSRVAIVAAYTAPPLAIPTRRELFSRPRKYSRLQIPIKIFPGPR